MNDLLTITTEEGMLYFKLLQGGPHSQVDPATGRKRVYSKGEVIESAADLNKRLDKNKERFKRLEDYEVESYLARQQSRMRKEQARQREAGVEESRLADPRLRATGKLQQQLPLPVSTEKSGKAVQDPYLVAPHGQVATGFQETVGTPEGQRTGLMVENTPDEAAAVESHKAAPSSYREYTTDELMEMRADELRELAEEEGVELKGLRSKEQIADAIVAETTKRNAQARQQQLEDGDDDPCDE